MGFFDPPTTKVMNVMPVSSHHDLGLVRELAEYHVARSVSKARWTYVIAMVMAAYARAHSKSGKFTISDRDDDTLQKIYAASDRVARDDGRVALAIISMLFEQGWMPKGWPNPFAFL